MHEVVKGRMNKNEMLGYNSTVNILWVYWKSNAKIILLLNMHDYKQHQCIVYWIIILSYIS